MATSRASKVLGNVLQEARKAVGMTQEEFAVKVRITRSHVSVVERGVKSPTFEVIVRMAKALKIPLGTLMTEVERKLTKN